MHILLERACSDSLDLMSRLNVSKARVGPDGRPVIRYSIFISYLKRIALTHNLQLNPLTSMDDTAHRTSAWRLSAECFAVQICFTKSSPIDCDGSVLAPGSTNFDELVHVSAVYFEHSHEQSVPCPELVSDLNAGKFDSLGQHIASLMTIYSVPGSNLDRVRAYLCLHVLEQDLSMLSQAQRADLPETERNALLALRPLAVHTMDPADRQRMVNASMVGLFLNRSGGRLARLIYLITPAQTAIAKAIEGHGSSDASTTRSLAVSSTRASSSRKNVDTLFRYGFSARVGLRSRLPFDEFVANQPTVQHLPFIPLVTLRETSFGDSVPDFAEPDELKCIALEAEFVLYLDPPVPMPTEAVRELESITGLKNSELLDKDEDDLVHLILSQHNQQYLYGINTHIQLPNFTQHSYTIRSHVRGFLVRTVPFTCSSQLSSIISVLRKHACLASFYETFVLHPRKPFEKDELMTFRFDITISPNTPLHVSFDHPCDPSRRVDLSIHIGPFGVTEATVHGGILMIDPHNNRSEFSSKPAINPTDIFARSHSFPVGLVWLLLRLGCPVQRSLRSLESSRSNPLTSDNHSVDTTTIPGISSISDRSLISTSRLDQLRVMLSRARSQVLIQGATDTGGILSGADRFSAPELDTPLLHSLTTSMASIGTRGSLKLPPLPPGVLATPPPVLTHSEHNSCDLVANALRAGDSQSKSLLTSGIPSPSPLASGPRGLRLDDLLIDNMVQQCFSSSASSVGVTATSSSSVAAPFGPAITASGGEYQTFSSNTPLAHTAPTSSYPLQSKLTSDMLTSPGLCNTTTVGSTVSPKQQQPLANATGSGTSCMITTTSTTTSMFPLPPSYGVRPGPVSVSTSSISIPGTFTQSSPVINQLVGAKLTATGNSSLNKAPTSGSMLVNLLNEDPLPPSVTPIASQSAHCIAQQRVSAPLAQPPPGVSNYPADPYAMPGTSGSGRFISSPPEKLSPLGSNKMSGNTLVPGTVGGLGSGQPKPSGLHSPRSSGGLMTGGSGSTSSAISKSRTSVDTYNLPASTGSALPMAVSSVTKKARKRRRGGGADSVAPPTSFKGGTVGNAGNPSAIPATGSIKHSRVDGTVLPHTSFHRSSYGSNTVNFASATISSGSSMAAVSSSVGPSSLHSGSALAPGKSVYDFDDNPNSSFDIPQSTISATTYQSGSTGITNKLTTSNYAPSSTTSSVSSANLALHPPVLSVTGSVGSSGVGPVAERTVERKTSLKMTIKTLPVHHSGSTSRPAVIGSATKIITAKLGSPDSKIKHPIVSGVPGIKQRKRRSVDGKPSSYMLQMLQHTSSNSLHSSTPMVGMKLPKSNTALSHATSLVKKERKRRIGHTIGERVPHVIQTSVGSSNLPVQPTTITESGKPLKPNRSRDNSAEDVRTKPPVSSAERVSSAVPHTSPVSGGSTVPGRKKFTGSPPSMSMSLGDEGSAIKRQHQSTISGAQLHTDPGDWKRRKHSENSKHTTGSHILNLSGSSLSESDDLQHASSSASTMDPASTSTGSVKHSSKSSLSTSHTSLTPGTNSRTSTSASTLSRISTAAPYSSGSQSSSLSVTAGGGGTSTSGTSVGLIKGYKIPKKKTITNQSNPANLIASKTDTSISSSKSTPYEVNTQLSSKSDTTNKDSPNSSALTSAQITLPVTSAPNSSATSSSTLQASHTNKPDSGAGTNQQTAASSNANSLSQPRRSSAKSISDIVDKLRAKSTTSSSSSSSAPSAGGSTTGPELAVPFDADRSNSSTEPFTPFDANASSENGPMHPDQRGDNIFEKFYPSTPTSSNHPTDLTKQQQSSGVAASTDNERNSPVFTSESDPGHSEATGGLQTVADSVDGADDERENDFDMVESDKASVGKQGKQYEVIKAQTDTPASPTESGASMVPTSMDSNSKIIPISPTSAKRMGVTEGQTLHTPSPHTDRSSTPQSRGGGGGALISRKNTSSARFPRPTLGVGAAPPHGSSDGYMRSMDNHARGVRPPRGFSHGMHRPKHGAFKSHSNWSAGPVDFTGSATIASGDCTGSPLPWRFPSGSGGAPGGVVGGGSQQFNQSNPHSMSMHGFQPSGPRPMQHPPGTFGAGGSMYGGPM